MALLFGDSEIKCKPLMFQLALLAICISVSIFYKQFVFITFAITLVTCLIGKNQYVFCQLFFLLPFTVIFKLSPSSSSFFAYLLLIEAVLLVLKRKLNIVMLFPVGIYTLIGLMDNPLLWIKLISCWVLLVFFVNNANENWVKHISISLSIGLIISSLWGLVKFDLPQLVAYADDGNVEYMQGELVVRFSGLYYDPNFFSVTIITALFLLLYFGVSGKLNKKVAFSLSAILLCFGSLSYSKMFVLAAVLVLYVQLKNLVKYSCVLIVLYHY